MKRILILLAVIGLAACNGHKNDCIVEGTIDGLEEGYITFTIKDNTLIRKDTVAVHGGKFHYEVEMPYPMRTVVNIIGAKGLFIFPFEPGYSYEMQLNAANLKKSQVSGGINSEIEAKLDSARVALLGGKSMDDFRKQIAIDKSNPKKLREELSVIESKFEDYVYSVCLEYPDSYFAADYLSNHFNKMPLESTIALYDAISKVYPAGKPRHSDLDNIESWISREVQLQKGCTLPPFTYKDVNGDKVSSAKVISEASVTMIEVWFSKRRSMEESRELIKELYENYHPRGLEIISINVDAANVGAEGKIAAMNLPWINICDPKCWEGKFMVDYNVAFIPSYILLDSSGHIIERNLSLPLLSPTISKLFE